MLTLQLCRGFVQVPFRDEAELVSHNNATGSYLHECMLRNIITCNDDLCDHVAKYTERHMYTDDQLGQVGLPQECCIISGTCQNLSGNIQYRTCKVAPASSLTPSSASVLQLLRAH